MELSTAIQPITKNHIPVFGIEIEPKNALNTKEKPSANDSASKELSHEDRCCLVAELAYYKAEARGFEPGHELEDWLSAEAEVT